MSTELSLDPIRVANAPALPGLVFRRFRGADDFPAMMRVLSASECTGLALSMNMARKRLGCSLRISSGIALQGIRPMMTLCPCTGVLA